MCGDFYEDEWIRLTGFPLISLTRKVPSGLCSARYEIGLLYMWLCHIGVPGRCTCNSSDIRLCMVYGGSISLVLAETAVFNHELQCVNSDWVCALSCTIISTSPALTTTGVADVMWYSWFWLFQLHRELAVKMYINVYYMCWRSFGTFFDDHAHN